MNVEKVLLPILHALSLRAAPAERAYVEMLKNNLKDITSPFISSLASSFTSLTPTEIAVCNMVRAGMRTKEIAQARGVAEATIHRHRETIRKKLKIANHEVNLATFLQAAMWEEKGRRGTREMKR